tara:strand:- start:699 stop:884 length:186 start_codon:yes stop_codon:yes gene_type:complete
MKDNSPVVKTIDEKEVKKELKNCPQIIQEYVKALETLREINRQSLNKSHKKVMELSAQLKK